MGPTRTIANRFELQREVGSGGSATVYRGLDRHSGDPVAVKILHLGTDADAERFAREANLLAGLSHPSIVGYVAHGSSAPGEAFLAMEWLDGEDLAGSLARARPSIAQSVNLAVQVARALEVLHARGVVHRDIKPQNIFLESGDLARPKLLDLGIARPTWGEVRVTLTGALIGTPAYMAPEQARGDAHLTPRVDVHALGCVLFECLAGRPPFVGDQPVAVLAKVLLEEAPRLGDVRAGVPQDLDELLSRMLAKDPSVRPADAAAVAAQLEELGELSEASEPAPRRTDSGRFATALTETEQRVISVVLAGAVDPAAKTLTPAADRAFEDQLARLAACHDARLERILDGTVLLTLAGTGAATDQAAKAARCALALRALVPDVPMVLATGRAVVSTRPRSGWAHLPVGEVIDRAAAKIRGSSTGRIRIDETTAGLLDSRFEVGGDAAGLYLHDERADVDAPRTLLGKQTPFVGRERELAALEALLAESIDEPVARVALVTAPAGAGKSRLRQEFLRRASERGERIEILLGRADALRAGSPFGPIAEAIRRSAGILAGEPVEVRHRRLRARVARHVHATSVERVTVFLGELVGAPFDGEADETLRAARTNPIQMGDAMRWAFEEWLTAECHAGPVLIVLENLHWGDLPTVTFVDAALRHLGDRPLMVLALARPEVATQFPNLWGDRGVQHLALAPLTRKAAERLVREVLGAHARREDVDLVLDRAEGNAFYLEELIRAVAARGDRRVPDSVVAMVQARLDALGADAKRLLRAASVFGGRFSRGGVMALLGDANEPRAVEAGLDELSRREVIVRGGRGSVPGDLEYGFRHALIREVAYSTLTEEDRVVGHRMAGEWLEQVFASDAMELGDHFSRGREPQQAVAWYFVSAQQALDGNDFAAAVERAERGVQCGAEGERLGALRLLQAEARQWQGLRPEAERQALEAAKLCPRGSAAWFRAVGTVARNCGRDGIDGAVSLVRGASQSPAAPDARTAQIQCLCTGSDILHQYGLTDLAAEVADRAEDLARDSTSLTALDFAALDRMRSLRSSYRGDIGGFLVWAVPGLETLETAGFGREACGARINIGGAFAELGQFARAEELLRTAHASAERLGLRELAAYAADNLARVLVGAGRPAEARACVERTLRILETGTVDPRLLGSVQIRLARILQLEGDQAGAAREVTAAIELLAIAPPLRVLALATHARVLLAQSRIPEALAQARAAIDLLRSVGSSEEAESSVWLGYVDSLRAAGERAMAHAALAAAEVRLRERASRILDPELRESFLTCVPDNARLLALAREWGPLSAG